MIGFDETVTRLRAVKRVNGDGLEVEQRDWANADPLTLEGVHVQPFNSRESMANDARAVTSQWVLISEPGAGDLDVAVGDRIDYRTRILDVVAEPERWPDLSGGVDHIEAILQAAPPGPGAGGDTTDGHIQAAVSGAAVGRGWRP